MIDSIIFSLLLFNFVVAIVVKNYYAAFGWYMAVVFSADLMGLL